MHMVQRGCSSVVEHNLAKVGVEGSNPFTRSKFSKGYLEQEFMPVFRQTLRHVFKMLLLLL